MRRREFITLVGSVATWPFAARAQQPQRRIGVLMNIGADDPEGQARIAAFLQGLQQLGWTDGRNVRVDTRWAGGSAAVAQKYAAELVALAPDVILASGTTAVRPLLQVARTLPVVFVNVVDPVGAGFVASLAKPGGNATGFVSFGFGVSAKLVELLKEVAPGVTRLAVIRDATQGSGTNQLAAIDAVASSFGLEVRPIDARDAGEIERGINAFARSPNGGLIATGSGLTVINHSLIAALATQNALPSVYPFRYFVASGGLMSYGPDTIDPFRRAADYVDRILRGEKSADLPVQQPTKFQLVINLKTAKALGLTVPPSLLVRADEVIE